MNHSYTVIAYFIYLPVALLLTWYVAQTLFRNGLVFMRDIFLEGKRLRKQQTLYLKLAFTY